ncbi:MAG: dienelactone hydrolase family protein [Novosphingobium sp.]
MRAELQTHARQVLIWLTAILLAALTQVVPAVAADYVVGTRQLTFVDETRQVKPGPGFAGAPERRLDVILWYPAKADADGLSEAPQLAGDGPWPLVIYSHGTFGRADNATHLVADLVRHGYVVAAPNYPLTSSTSYTGVKQAQLSDVIEQTRDVRFVIDRLLADEFIGPAIDKAKIGTTGHSLGGVTSYFTSFGLQTRDPRIAATAMIGAGDPVQSALSQDMGLAGTAHAAVSVPALFLSAEKDVFARMTGRPHAAYSRIEKPKYEIMIKGGVHVWFRDGNTQTMDFKNPDCLFFEKWAPGMAVPGCEERVPLIGPAKQQEITRVAIRSFFDAYLKGDDDALARLRGLEREFAAIDLTYDD